MRPEVSLVVRERQVPKLLSLCQCRWGAANRGGLYTDRENLSLLIRSKGKASSTSDQVASDCERVRRGPTSEQEIDALFVELGFRKVDEGLAPDPTAGG